MRERILLCSAVLTVLVGSVVAVAATDSDAPLVQETTGDSTGARAASSTTATTDPASAGDDDETTTTTAAPAIEPTTTSVPPVVGVAPDPERADPVLDEPTAPAADVGTAPPPTAAPPDTANRPGVFALDAATGAVRVLVDGYFSVQAVAPRGDRLLVGPPLGDWFILDLDGRRTPVPTESWGVPTGFSPDGRRLVYAGGGRFAVWDSDRPSEPLRTVLQESNIAMVEWSPTEELLMFTPGSGSTEVIRPDGSGRRAVAGDPFGRFSPDGSSLLFDHQGAEGRRTILEVRDLDGALVADLTPDLAFGQQITGAVWSPDGRSIAYVLEGQSRPWRPCVVDVATATHACGDGDARYYLGWTADELLAPNTVPSDAFTTELRAFGRGGGTGRVVLPANEGRLYHVLVDGGTVLATGEVVVSVHRAFT